MPWIYNLIGIIVLLLIVIAIWALLTLHQDGTKCLANPIKYTANNLAKANNQNIMCSCNGLDKQTEPLTYQSDIDFRK